MIALSAIATTHTSLESTIPTCETFRNIFQQSKCCDSMSASLSVALPPVWNVSNCQGLYDLYEANSCCDNPDSPIDLPFSAPSPPPMPACLMQQYAWPARLSSTTYTSHGSILDAGVYQRQACLEFEGIQDIRYDQVAPCAHSCPYTYYMRLPEGYDDDPDRKFPVIIGLHGGWSNANTALSYLDRFTGAPSHVSIAPVKTEIDWTPWKIRHIIDELLDHRIRIDLTRLILTGTSMGGRGAIIVGAQLPDLFPTFYPACPHHTPYDYITLAPLIRAHKQYVHIGMTAADRTSSTPTAIAFTDALQEYGRMTITQNSTAHCGASVVSWQEQVVVEALVSSQPPYPPSVPPSPPSPPPVPCPPDTPGLNMDNISCVDGVRTYGRQEFCSYTKDGLWPEMQLNTNAEACPTSCEHECAVSKADVTVSVVAENKVCANAGWASWWWRPWNGQGVLNSLQWIGSFESAEDCARAAYIDPMQREIHEQWGDRSEVVCHTRFPDGSPSQFITYFEPENVGSTQLGGWCACPHAEATYATDCTQDESQFDGGTVAPAASLATIYRVSL